MTTTTDSPITPPADLPPAGHRVVGPPTDDPVSPIRAGEPHPHIDEDEDPGPLGGVVTERHSTPYNERDTFMMLVCSPCGFVQWFYLSDAPETHLAHFMEEHAGHQV